MTARGFFLPARISLGVCAAAALAASTPAFADEVPAPPLPSPAVVAAAITVPVTNRAVLMPGGRSADIQVHWAARREYVHDRDERRADDEEQRVRGLKDDLALENLFSVGAALVRESRAALSNGALALAVQRCKLAVELAPALPDAHTGLARALLANALAILFVGLLAAGFTFAVVMFFRHANLYAHDVQHLVPGRAGGWQGRMLAAVLLLSPVLLQMGAVPLLFTALIAAALYATTAEVVVSVVFLAVLALSPLAAEKVGEVAAFSGAATDVWLIEHGEGTGAEVGRLLKRLESANELPVSFALARKAKRDGDLATAEKLYLRALEVQGANPAGLAPVRNNLGNVYLLQGDATKAIAQYQQAIDLKENLAAAHFNISRALAMGGVDTLEKVQSEQARALELDRAGIDAFTGGQLQANRKANKFVLDAALDPAQLEPLIDAEEKGAEAVGDELRAQLAGRLPIGLGMALPVLTAMAVLALHFLSSRLRPSGRCDRCGREVCKRCDSDARPAEALCAQCVNVFVRRSGVDAQERARKEYAVETYHRRRHLVARGLAVLAGAGHLVRGETIRGLFYLVMAASLFASIVLWRGVAHEPLAVQSGIPVGRVLGTIVVLAGLYWVCLRDLFSRQRGEEGA